MPFFFLLSLLWCVWLCWVQHNGCGDHTPRVKNSGFAFIVMIERKILILGIKESNNQTPVCPARDVHEHILIVDQTFTSWQWYFTWTIIDTTSPPSLKLLQKAEIFLMFYRAFRNHITLIKFWILNLFS